MGRLGLRIMIGGGTEVAAVCHSILGFSARVLAARCSSWFEQGCVLGGLKTIGVVIHGMADRADSTNCTASRITCPLVLAFEISIVVSPALKSNAPTVPNAPWLGALR